jgi:UDP-galactopyranose mutase
MTSPASPRLNLAAADPIASRAIGQRPTLVVFSHLRWGFVYQRPQQLLSRLAGRWRVVFIEEPIPAPGPARMARHPDGPHLEVWVPHTPSAAPGFHDDQLTLLKPLIADGLAAAGINADAVLLYTPMALPLLKVVGPDAPVFYDCMDELSAFKDAPRQLRQREAALLQRATAVLTGGPSLYEAKRRLHEQVHFLPSAVDAAHYEPRRLQAGSAPALAALALQGNLPRPRLGYFGVIDERLDVALIDTISERHPEWQIVMAGPVVKFDPATLPQRHNLHWLGMQPYDRLPYLLAGWDVALMPFALNESTRFISPTKTLEYIAGEKPVVSTAVRDVISLYGHVVEVAHGADAFIATCERLLAENSTARCRRSLEMMATVSMVSWDRAAQYVDTLLQSARLERTKAGPPRVMALGVPLMPTAESLPALSRSSSTAR